MELRLVSIAVVVSLHLPALDYPVVEDLLLADCPVVRVAAPSCLELVSLYLAALDCPAAEDLLLTDCPVVRVVVPSLRVL